MPVDVVKMTEQDLVDFMWLRLRREDPDHFTEGRFCIGAPEFIFLDAWRSIRKKEAGIAFRLRLIQAAKANLTKIRFRNTENPLDKKAFECIASLAFLSAELDANELGEEFLSLARFLLILRGGDFWSALYHSLHTVAHIGNSQRLVSFWQSLLDDSQLFVRDAAYDGLLRADIDAGLAELPRMLNDKEYDATSLAWSLAENLDKGILAKAVKVLDSDHRKKFRKALLKSGTTAYRFDELCEEHPCA